MIECTPGPWEVRKSLVAGSDCLHITSKTGERIAVVKRLADAHIIAATPETIIALENARDEIAEWGAYASEYFQNKHDLPGALSRIDAFLARLKGGQA